MTREEAIKGFEDMKKGLYPFYPDEYFDMAIKALEQEPTTKNDLEVDCIKKSDAIDIIQDMHGLARVDVISDAVNRIITMPTVTPQEPKTGHCKDCKWWKDSDGVFRRGFRAESQCPMNRIEVFEGNGYCYMFEPQESEDQDGQTSN